MYGERAPGAIAAAVADGLLGPDLRLAGAVVVKVPLRRRDRFGWPAAIFSAVVRGPVSSQGFLGVWALSRGTNPISSLNSVACEFSRWPLPRGRTGSTALAVEIVTTYPEVRAAELAAMSVDREGAPRP